jgi:hypothetical protein
MALPQTVRVKLMSEAAGFISLSPVVAQDLAVRDLIESILAVTGKDEPRIREILLRGTMIVGASRFRWAGWDADAEAVRQLLAGFPDSDPARPFAAERCTCAIFMGGRQEITILRDAAARRRLFRRRTFWDDLMAVAGEGAAAYAEYSYRYRADRYVRELSPAEAGRIREAARKARFGALCDQVRPAAFTRAELFAER